MEICKRFSECYPNSSREYVSVHCTIRGSVCRDYEREGGAVEPIFRPRPVDKEIDQLKSHVLSLEKKYNALIDVGKRKAKPSITSGTPRYKDGVV